MHLTTLDYTPVESELSTPSDIFDEFSRSPEFHEAWSTATFAMTEQNYSDQFGRLTAPSQDWTPSSAVSSFNLPIIYDSTLTTPVSLNPESPNPHGKNVHETQWGRSDYQSLRSNDGIYINTSSMSMKSKNDSLTLPISDADLGLSISPYVFDSPSTPCPPTPYWGSFSVSAPQPTSTSTTATTPKLSPNPNVSMPSGSRNQTPILMAPNLSNLRPRQIVHDEDLGSKQQHHGQPIQIKVQPQPQLQQIHPHAIHIKRECSSPTLRPKRRRRSAPPVEQHKALSKDDLSEEDKILLHLRDRKEEEKWDWKELTDRFNKQTGGKHNLAALQMRHTRLVERMRVWTDVEIQALKRAMVQYDNQKWKTIAETMLEYGCETKWSPHACQLKWHELHPGSDEYDLNYGSWSDNLIVVSSPVSKESKMHQDDDDVGDDGGDNFQRRTSIFIDQSQPQRPQPRHRGSASSTRSGSVARGSKNLYEQRQEWTVRPQ